MQTAGERAAAADVLARAKARTARCELVLDGDLVAEHEQLSVQLESVAQDSPDALLLAEQINELELRMADVTVEVVFRGMGRGRWRKLMADHPAPDDVKALGFSEWDPHEFPFAAMAVCLVEPAWTAEQLRDLVDEVLSEAQFQEIWGACLLANIGSGVSRPESRAAHAIVANGRHRSEQPSDSESAEAS